MIKNLKSKASILLIVCAAHFVLLLFFLTVSSFHPAIHETRKLQLPVPLKMIAVDVITTPAPLGNTLNPAVSPKNNESISIQPPSSNSLMKPVKTPRTINETAHTQHQAARDNALKQDSAPAPELSEMGRQVATTAVNGQGRLGEGVSDGKGNTASGKTGPENAGSNHSSPGNKIASNSDGGFSNPSFGAAYLNNPAPQYPPLARRLGQQGKVMLRVLVSAEGLAKEVMLHASSGSGLLDQAALKAVRHWRFVPARQGDTSVTAWVQVPILFQLNQGDSQ